MTPAELTAATALYTALSLFPCTCQRLFAYHGPMVRECRRCKALREWDQLLLEQAAA